MNRRQKVELFEQIRREYEFGVGTVAGVAPPAAVAPASAPATASPPVGGGDGRWPSPNNARLSRPRLILVSRSANVNQK